MMDPASFTFAGIAKAIGIRGFVGIGLAIALAIVMWRADSISEARDKAQKSLIVEQANHDVTRASLDGLELRLDEMVAEGELRAERRDKALEEVAEETAGLREQADKLERGEIDITEVEGL